MYDDCAVFTSPVRCLMLTLAAGIALTPCALGQTPYEVPGEQRLNTFQFHSTHNSYERDEACVDFSPVSLTEQLDRFDVWHVELDLRWDESLGPDGDFWIMHDCAEDCGNASLDTYLSQIQSSARATRGVTFIYFDSGDIGPCVFFPNIVPKPAVWRISLESKLEAAFPGRVYRKADFNSDGGKWPSAQELLRRGKNIIPFTNGASTQYFFGEAIMIRNTPDEEDPVTQANLGDGGLARHYPSDGAACFFGDDGWQWAIDNGYNFPSSNCSDQGIVDQFHPPLPTYVESVGGDPADQRGTWTKPYTGASGVVDAISRIESHEQLQGPSMIELSIEGGTFTRPGGTIDTTVRLKARPGQTVVIQ